MNLFEAEKIMELHGKYDTESLKKQYKKLAMKYHPDRCKDPKLSNKMTEINSAYSFLLKRNDQYSDINIDDDIMNMVNELFKSFVTPPFSQNGTIPGINIKIHKMNFPTNIYYNETTTANKLYEVDLSVKEYVKGFKKLIAVDVRYGCTCDFVLCTNCAGTGYQIPVMGVCMECTGVGWFKNCEKCTNGVIKKEQMVEINGDSYINLDEEYTYDVQNELNNKLEFFSVKYRINSNNYEYKDSMLIYKMDITLKQALTGLHTTFKDPLGIEHEIEVHNLISKGDAYVVPVNDKPIFILFNINYPKKISQKVKKQLLQIDF